MRLKSFFVLLLSLFFITTACNCSPTAVQPKQTLPDQTERMTGREKTKVFMEHISERTVDITFDCRAREGVIIFGIPNPDRARDSRGTGAIVRSYKEGSYIFTAAHVVTLNSARDEAAFACDIYIRRNKDIHRIGGKYLARIVAMDVDKDIAVLAVDGEDFGVNSELELHPFLGENIWAAGYPAQLSDRSLKTLSITKGVVASLDIPGGSSVHQYGAYLRITSQVYFGNSGGGVWNKEGKLVGVVNALWARSGLPYEGQYFSKPVQEIIELLKSEWRYWEVFRE